MPDLNIVPIVDAREGGAVRHAQECSVRAQSLRAELLGWFPFFLPPLLPLLDAVARRWLQRAGSPYVQEIAAIASVLGFPGVWFLNNSYQWTCTSLARSEDGAPWLVRTLDWPFPGLGRYVDVVQMRGPAGDYYNISWPGYAGVLTALAPGRFAAAINQAPMRRRGHGRALRLYDLAANAVVTTLRVREVPPDHLLRRVFEICCNYTEARRMLEKTPVARPVIFTLVGCAAGEHCVIERTEREARTREHETVAANDWRDSKANWEARIGTRRLLSVTFEEAAANSRERCTILAGWRGSFARDSFCWVRPPVLNYFTRLAAEMCPESGTLRVVGYEIPPGGELPEAVTLRTEISVPRVAA
ncbi:MAG TPA: hypothetical protein VNL39_03330 [Xanthobacteraceae bacterium]|nr:hypothetical protein [Xanthobacteraceae bacterium]